MACAELSRSEVEARSGLAWSESFCLAVKPRREMDLNGLGCSVVKSSRGVLCMALA